VTSPVEDDEADHSTYRPTKWKQRQLSDGGLVVEISLLSGIIFCMVAYNRTGQPIDVPTLLIATITAVKFAWFGIIPGLLVLRVGRAYARWRGLAALFVTIGVVIGMGHATFDYLCPTEGISKNISRIRAGEHCPVLPPREWGEAGGGESVTADGAGVRPRSDQQEGGWLKKTTRGQSVPERERAE